MPAGTIQAATPKDQWQSEFGTFQNYEVTLDPGGTFQINRKVKADGSHKPLPVGSVLHYEAKGNGRITEVNPEFAGQPTQPNATATTTVRPAPSQAARNESIERQVAAKCAAEVAVGYLTSDKLAVVDAPLIAELTDAFHQAIRGYKVEADPKDSIAQDSLPAADTEGLTKPDPDDDIPF